MMWLLAVAAAFAGSSSGPGIPVVVPLKDEFEPMTHVGVEGGTEILLGSNGAAFAPGPATHVYADIQDTNNYRVQLGWTWTGHALADASKLFRDDVSLQADDGYVSTHTISAGAKVMPLAREKKSAVRLIDPWVYTGTGLSMAFAQVAWKGISEPVSTQKLYLVLDGGAGLDIRPIKAFSLAPSLRLQVHPGLRKDPLDGKIRFEGQLAIQPGLGVAIHI